MIINQIRKYYEHFTESVLFVEGVNDGGKFCFVLEDVGRPHGIKIPGVTCIPEGVYNVIVSKSNRWNKDMLLLYNKEDLSIQKFGIKFTGIRPHGGNRVGDTAGCPILNYNTDHKGGAWNRASDDLFSIVKPYIDKNEPVTWIIIN